MNISFPSITAGHIVGVLSSLATVLGSVIKANIFPILNIPGLGDALIALGVVLAPVAGHLPGAGSTTLPPTTGT